MTSYQLNMQTGIEDQAVELVKPQAGLLWVPEAVRTQKRHDRPAKLVLDLAGTRPPGKAGRYRSTSLDQGIFFKYNLEFN